MKQKLIIAAVVLCAVIAIFFAQKKEEPGKQAGMPPAPGMMMPAPNPNAPPAKVIDPKDMEIAMKIAKSFGSNDRIKGSLMGMTMGMMPMIYQANPGQMDKIQKVVNGVVDKVVAAHDEDAQKDKAQFFAQNFSTDELEQLKTFYESSAGQKLIKSSDEMSRRDAMFGQSVAMSGSMQVRDELFKALKKNDIKVPKAMGGSD
jgi:hypothetical protein